MLRNYQKAHKHNLLKKWSYKLDLTKLEKLYLDVFMNHISTKSVQQFERGKMCLTNFVLLNPKYRS